MSDSIAISKRGEFSRHRKIDDMDLRRHKIEGLLPANFVSEYPDFVKFLTAYYDFLDGEEGLDRLIERLRDIRNADIASGDNLLRLKEEYGEGFPSSETMSESEAIKIFHRFFRAKGTPAAIQAYFRIFLNTDSEIIYPEENMLRTSDGEWDNDAKRWKTSQGHLSEVTQVLQDSTFYQAYSYLIRSGVSIADWGETFRKLMHPAGWALFGEVRLDALARFEQFELITASGSKSPTIVPGFQIRDANLLIIGAALWFIIGSREDVMDPARRSQAFTQFVRKFWKVVLAKEYNLDLTLRDANKKILGSTYALGSLKDYKISDFFEPTAKTREFKYQRPARIIVRDV